MKMWNEPKIEELDISATEKHANQGNGDYKICKYNPAIHCNAKGNGNGICKNCEYNEVGINETLSQCKELSVWLTEIYRMQMKSRRMSGILSFYGAVVFGDSTDCA